MRLSTLAITIVAILALPMAKVVGLIDFAPSPSVATQVVSATATSAEGAPTTLALPTSTAPAMTQLPAAALPPTTVPAPVVPGAVWSVVHVPASGVAVYAEPTDPGPSLVLAADTEFGTPRVLLAVEQREGWWRVLLPTRPNNATGWVHAVDVSVTTTTDEIHVSLQEDTLEWVRGNTLVRRIGVAVGSPASPTPPGTYFVTDVLPGAGAYGPRILALNGHSDTYSDFGGGDARLALHGTNEPRSIGFASSHGCVRLPNDEIMILAQSLAPGTPVIIT